MNAEMKLLAVVNSTKTGVKATFELHPNDAAFLLGKVGARFGAALVEIGDDEKPVKPAPQNRIVQRAGILCGDSLFQRFLQNQFPHVCNEARERNIGEPPGEIAADVLREILAVKSRADLATDGKAQQAFDRIVARFEMWKRGENV